jgi:hypothetical protein
MAAAPALTASRTRFYSQLDERAFFDWLSRIPCVDSYRGEGDALNVLLKSAPGPEDLRDLLAICFRSEIDTRQLSQFLT